MDIGNKCVDCMRDTSFGRGLFVNRIPADRDDDKGYREGYLCGECVAIAEKFFDENKKD